MMRSTNYLDSDNVYAQGQGELSIGNFMASSEPATRAESAQRYCTIGGLLTTSSGGHAPGGNQPVSVDGNRWTGNRWTGNRWTGGAWLGDAWG